jgi:hypothetical protein
MHPLGKIFGSHRKPGCITGRISEQTKPLKESKGLKHCGVDADAD